MIVFRREQEQLTSQLDLLRRKVIVGGENLLEKAEAQERLLEESARALAEQMAKQDRLARALEEKEVGERWVSRRLLRVPGDDARLSSTGGESHD